MALLIISNISNNSLPRLRTCTQNGGYVHLDEYGQLVLASCDKATTLQSMLGQLAEAQSAIAVAQNAITDIRAQLTSLAGSIKLAINPLPSVGPTGPKSDAGAMGPQGRHWRNRSCWRQGGLRCSWLEKGDTGAPGAPCNSSTGSTGISWDTVVLLRNNYLVETLIGRIVTIDGNCSAEYISLKLSSNGSPVVRYPLTALKWQSQIDCCNNTLCANRAHAPRSGHGREHVRLFGADQQYDFPVNDISYHDDANDDLKLAICNDLPCASRPLSAQFTVPEVWGSEDILGA